MKTFRLFFKTLFTAMLLLVGHCAFAQNDIVVTKFLANGVPSDLYMNPDGYTPIDIQATVGRSNGSLAQTYAALYVASTPPSIGSSPSTKTVNGLPPTGSDAISTFPSIITSVWTPNTSNNNVEFKLRIPRFLMGYGSEGVVRGVSLNLYLVLIDNNSNLIFHVSPGINIQTRAIIPYLADIYPQSAAAGTTIRLKGAGFSSAVDLVSFRPLNSPTSPSVQVNAFVQYDYISFQYFITAVIPASLAPGTYEVKALAAYNGVGYSSNVRTLDVLPAGLCSNNLWNICSTRIVPYMSIPPTIVGQTAIFSTDDPSFQWEYSYTNGEGDADGTQGWNKHNTTSKNFTPWACWQTAYFQRITTFRGSTDSKLEVRASNTVMVIPYVNVREGLTLLRNRKTGYVLEIGGTGQATLDQGTIANQWPYTGTANQQWNIVSIGAGKYKLLNRNSGQALEIGGYYARYREARGAKANQWPYTGTANQQWVFTPVYNTPYYTITNVSTGQVLEIGGGSPANEQAGAEANQWHYAYPQADKRQQEWELVPIDIVSSTKFPGIYTIENNLSHQVLEIGAASKADAATANQWPYVGTANQEWVFNLVRGSDIYKIVNRNSQQVLEIGGGYPKNTYAGAKANQWPYELGDAAQEWQITENSNGTYRFTNMASQQVLEIGGTEQERQTAGTLANQWNFDPNGAHQQWIIRFKANSFSANTSQTSSSLSSGDETRDLDGAVSKLVSKPIALDLYPNPTSTKLKVELKGASKLSYIRVSDLRGSIISNIRYIKEGLIDVSALPNGIYIVTASDGKREYHQKFIKQ